MAIGSPSSSANSRSNRFRFSPSVSVCPCNIDQRSTSSDNSRRSFGQINTLKRLTAWIAQNGDKFVREQGGSAPGLVEPAMLCEVRDLDETWRGLCLGVEISAEGIGASRVRQTLRLERHYTGGA
ncbi:hypothetical protein D9M69_558440 [compost metagenome]